MNEQLGGRHLLRGGSAAVIFRLSSTGLSVIMAVIVARTLPPSAVGAFMLAIVLTTFLSAGAMLGLENTMVRRIAQAIARGEPAHARAIVRASMPLVVGAAGMTGVVLVLFREPLLTSSSRAPLLAASATAIAVWLGGQAVEASAAAALRGMHQLATAAVFQTGLVRGALQVVATLGLLASDALTLPTVLWASAFAGVASAAVASIQLQRRLPAENIANPPVVVPRRQLLSESWPLMAATILTYGLAQLDLWLAARYGGGDSSAIYGTMLRLTFAASLPLLVLNFTTSPMIAAMHARGDLGHLERRLRTLASAAALATLVVLLMFLLGGRGIVQLLFGEYYLRGFSVLIVLTIGQFINVLTGSCGTTLMMTGHQRFQLALSGASVVVLVGAAAFAAPRWGALGVAVASAGTTTVNNLVALLIVRQRVGIATHAFLTPRSIVSALRVIRQHVAPLHAAPAVKA